MCNRVRRFVRGQFRKRSTDRANRLVDMLTVNVRIPQHHRRRLMPADPLDRRQVDAGQHELRDRRVAHDMRPNQLGIEPAAARRCAEAKDGQILIAQRVAVAIEQIVAIEEIGSLTLKGLTRPVVAFNVPLAASQPALRVIKESPQGV